jgi:hypothetical protein
MQPFELKPPFHILPAIHTEGNHPELAQKIGIVIGTLAIAKESSQPEYYLVQVPAGWTETNDEFGQYLVDERNRRRIHFASTTRNEPPTSRLLTRFDVQQHCKDYAWKIIYVRKIIGGERNIFQLCWCSTEVRYDTMFYYGERGWSEHPMLTACRQWLNEKFPDWQNPLAYWDID